jgi:subtilisin family serine protease
MWFLSPTSAGRPVRRNRQASAKPFLEPLEDRCLLSTGVVPDDPRFQQQWGLEAIEAPRAWEVATGSSQVVVADIDSGIAYTHPDLYKNVWINQAEIPRDIRRNLTDVDGDGLLTFWDLNEPVNQGPGKITDLNGTGFIDGGDLLRPGAEGGWADGRDSGHNGYIDDLIGWDFFDNDNDPMDTFGHGTYVAGVIGAVGNNGVGMAGINWQVQIMPLRFYPDRGVLDASPIQALYYAVDNDARVSSNSYSRFASFLPPEVIAAGDAAGAYVEAHDHLFVTIAGNHGVDVDVSPILPGSFPHDNIITVAATDRIDQLARFATEGSNFGAVSVDLGAPGIDILTTVPGGRYGMFDGTSMAAPFVAGAAALILARNPGLSYAEVKALILDNVDVVPDLVGKTVTGGRLNLFRAVSATPLPLVASSAGSAATTESLTLEQVAPQWTEALSRWQVTGRDTSSLASIDIRIADLSGALLGMASGNTLWLDANAAAWGWFVDPTPWDDAEFITPGNQGEQHRIDLLSVVMHEMGHLLGLEHDKDGVMAETLAAGTRLARSGVADTSQFASHAFFALFASDEEMPGIGSPAGRKRQKR